MHCWVEDYRNCPGTVVHDDVAQREVWQDVVPLFDLLHGKDDGLQPVDGRGTQQDGARDYFVPT